VLAVSASAKQLQFNWASVPEAMSYRLLQDPDGDAGELGFTPVGAALGAGATGVTLDIVVDELDWVHARYRLDACTGKVCSSSLAISAESAMLDAIGYFKASKSDAYDHFGPQRR
jgi:hypothetical protein